MIRAACPWLLVLAAALAGVGGCGPAADQVELRLFPCALNGGDGGQPQAVVVEITGFDSTGTVVETFEVGFDGIVGEAFDDGYATVGYRSDASVVTADIRVGWFAAAVAGTFADADAVVVYEDLAVPAHGKALTLGSEAGCEPIAGDGDGDTSGDGDGDTSGDGDGDTSGDGDGDTSGDGDGDTSGDGDGDTMGDGDGDTMGDGDGDTGVDVPMPGDDCDLETAFYCSPVPNDGAGTTLRCEGGVLATTDLYDVACGGVCNFLMIPGVELEQCGGYGYPAVCLCLPNNPEPCDQVTLGCDGDRVTLCHAGEAVIGECKGCMEVDGFYACMR